MNGKLLFCTGFWLLLFYTSFSQQAPPAGGGKIKGRIIDSATRQPIGYCTVMAFLNGSANVAGGNLTDDKGQFIIDNLANGTYEIKIEFIGYTTVSKTGIILSDKKATVNLGDIKVASTAHSLKEVGITANRNFMENKLDKLVYNVDKDITSQGGVATDILKKIPMVSVDIDGNVDLLGDTNVRIFINGKPSAMFDNNLAEALKSIPASQIKTIEVITNPGAQYDAQGSGGIINIVLKDNDSKWVNGNCNLSLGTRYENGSANLHIKNGKLDINASVSGNEQLNTRTLSIYNRNADSTGLTQNGYSDVQRNGYRLQTGFDYEITKKDDLSGSVSYNDYGSFGNGSVSQDQITEFPIPIDTLSLRNTNNFYRYKGEDWSVNYKKKFNTEGQELNISYYGSFGASKNTYEQSQYYTAEDSLFSGAKGTNGFKDLETNVTVDYTHPFSKDVVLNVGIKGNFSMVNSTSDYYGLIPSSGDYLLDSSQLNSFNYNRDIYAAYSSITFPVFKNYTVKIGVRDEYTVTKIPDDTLSIASYNFISPSGVISRKLGDKQTIKLSYSRRIQRPGFYQYNPFINATDPLNLTSGNPGLLPQKMHSLEASYYKFFDGGSNILVTLFYRLSNYDWQGYSTYYSAYQVGDSTYKNTTLSTTINAGTQQTGGLNISGTWVASKKLEIRSSGSLFEKYIQSSLISGGSINNMNYRINVNLTYQFTKDLTAEFYSNYNSQRVEAQGKFPAFASYSFAVRQQLLNKKASLAFTTTDPFNKYTNQISYISAENFSSMSESRYAYQIFGISFSYKFGKIEYKEKKQENPESEQPQGNAGENK